MGERKIMESKSKKEQMIARARTAKSTQQVNDMLGGITGKTSMDAFTRMEEKVEALEAAAEMSAEMGMMSLPSSAGSGSSTANSLEKEFRLLEASSSVDEEFEKMKKGLLNAAGEGSVPSNKQVEADIERLKVEVGLK